MKLSKTAIELVMAKRGLNYGTLSAACGYKTVNGVGLIIKRGSARPITVARLAKGLNVDIETIIVKENV